MERVKKSGLTLEEALSRIEALEAKNRALEAKNRALEAALASSEEVNQAKSRFLSNMSHDIRTPMNAIMGMTAIALSHIDEKPRVRDCLDKVRTASVHMMSLVNNVLDISRIDSGRLVLGDEEFSLADLVHDIAVIVRPQAQQKSQELKLEIGPVTAERLTGDPLRLRQILVNIISNAVKYTPAGGAIRVRFAQDPPAEGCARLHFLCEDNGIGMSEAFLERIFLPFERAEDQVAQIEGTGLGMSIVKSLVDRMGGTISVESREGEGSRFRVELPVSVSRQERPAPVLPVGRTALVAENRPEAAGLMAAYLEEGGLVPVCLSSGMEAVAWLTEARVEDRSPCAVLLGQELSDMSPLDLASHLREVTGQALPILLVSEEDWARLEYRAGRAGISAFVPCPLFPSRFLGAISDLLAGGGETGGSRDIDCSGLRVLLAEDNELNLEIAVELLGMTGARVETAGNGQEALDRFRAAPEGWYDLILMDIQMPVMDGYKAARRIRALDRPDARSVCIAAMTANAFVEDVRQAREAGMDEHIAKPVDLDRLRELLYSRLEGRTEK